MDPPLEDKIAFFTRLDVFSGDDPDEGDVEKDVVRKQAKAFVAAAGAQASRGAGANAGPNKVVRRKPIRDTPEGTRRRPSLRGTGSDSDALSTSVAVETPIAHGPPAPSVAPPSRPFSSFPVAAVEETRAGGQRRKRKREPEMQRVSPARRHFRDLRFFYVPDNDIDPARKLRIRRAREHGAAWTRSPSEATHVIADKGLSRADVEAALGPTPPTGHRVVVNDNYPTDCIQFGRLLPADQRKYQVRNADDKTSVSPARDGASTLPPPPRRVHHASPSAAPGSPPERQPSPRLATAAPAPAADAPGSPPRDDLGSFMEHIQKWGDDVVILSEADDRDADPGVEEAALGDGSPPREARSPPSLPMAKGSGGREAKFACMHGGTKDGWSESPNADTIAMLKKLADEYVGHDRYRQESYHKAAAALAKQEVKILTARDAKKMRGIGQSIADTIEEIAKEGRSRKLKALREDPHNRIRATFLGIYGVGLEQANRWIQEGLRTLDDVRDKACLSTHQRLGLEHYDDLNTRIPRREVEALGRHVKRAAQAIDPEVQLIIGGSYRRGADTSGDIDLIVTKQGTRAAGELVPFLDELVARLGREHFLTATLAAHRRSSADDTGGTKWHGCCVLPADEHPGHAGDYRPVWRRIDLLLVPETELGAALIYFTGDDGFNRSIRLKYVLSDPSPPPLAGRGPHVQTHAYVLLGRRRKG